VRYNNAMPFEGPPKKIPIAESPIPQQERHHLRERLFNTLVAEKIIDKCSEDMARINEEFASLTEKDKRAFLAIPAQLRVPLFARYAAAIAEGKNDAKGMVHEIVTNAHKYGFTLGFHLSPNNIRPKPNGSWVIEGREKDHRHDDRAMAYYSTTYNARYLKKNAPYLYAVRAEIKEGSGHYPDNNGEWGHAPTLSIVDQIDLIGLENELNVAMKEVEGSTKATDK
jgi:hypothetical protein